jgi:L,D-transpeptidase ErfK/SrfK
MIFNHPHLSYKFKALATILGINLLINTELSAKTFILPTDGSDVVGEIQTVSPNELKYNDNFLTISKKYGVGFHELEEANPGANPWSSNYGDIVIPHKYVLPKTRKGIVINLAELRLYYFPSGSNVVMTFPVGIGKKNWSTPLVNTKVTHKVVNPTWTVPSSVKKEYAERGEKIANSIPPGPNNPLGKHVLKLSEPGYLIHGTNDEDIGVGLRISHGCIRMFNDDVKSLFDLVPAGTPVTIINEPYKIGHDGHKIYLEAHKPLAEDGNRFDYNEGLIKERLYGMNTGYDIDWNATEYVGYELRGIPAPIGNVRHTNSYLETNKRNN